METQLQQILEGLGINPRSMPPGQVNLLDRRQIHSLGGKAIPWAKDPLNSPALAYAIDDEHRTPVGMVLRNLHSGPDRSHLTIVEGKGPFFHNLHCSLPVFYDTGVAVLVEGPKDARVLWTNGIPAAAYLGPAPGKEHLKVLNRYVDVILWIPDSDPYSFEVENRKKKVHQIAESIGINLIEFKIPEKDPAELIKNPSWFGKISARTEELGLLL
jgi:hypothetical protein